MLKKAASKLLLTSIFLSAVFIGKRAELVVHGFQAVSRPQTQGCSSLVSLAATSSDMPDTEDGAGSNEDLSLEAFQRVKESKLVTEEEEDGDSTFDGYALRDVILAKWGECYDVEFNRVDYMGFRKVYLNILPFYLGRRPFRHETEYDYLCHLQAVVEILVEYDQLNYVLCQIDETKKRPLPGRSPIVAVPCRLDLTDEQVKTILG
jgi:Domain of unknown function (DUF3067)